MVRGNWQRRVEKTESRRNEAKLKKQRNEERRLGKAKLNELLSMMDRNKDSIFSQSHQRSWELHIWTDAILSDWPPLLDMNLDDNHAGSGGGNFSSKQKRRNRSASIESEGSASGGGGGGRKPSTSGSKKKAHPRSKEANSSEADTGTSVAAPRLCRFQFFTGKCTSHGGGGKKGGGCRHLHYPKTQKTIAQVLLNTATNNSGDASSSNRNDATNILNQCESAHPEVQDEEHASSDAGSMEMLCYFAINLTMEAASRKRDDSNNPTISDIVGDVMAKKSCGLGSIVYVALCENLVFDRHRDGILLSESDLMTTVFGLNNAAGGAAASGSLSSSTEIDTDIATALPGPVLEYVLTFLPDTAVASMSSVCRSWNTEIGKQSVHLWQYLLQRRSWPIPAVATTEDGPENNPTTSDNKDIYRKAFLSHYGAFRDIKGLKLGMTGLLTKQSVQEKEACFRSFEHMRGSPQYPNPCISVEVSSNRILVAYSHDCSLRLFDSVQKAGTGDERLCREILCVCLDPYKNTKKRNCQIVGLALDDEWIGSLFHVMEGSTKGEATLLRVLAREDFLLSDGSIEEDHVKTIDVSQSILNYVLSCDDMDHGVLQLNDFLSSGGDFDDIEVLVSQSIVACGFGRFLVEASISIPLLDETDDDDDDESDANMTLLFRKLFLISSGVGAIVWMCSSDIPNRPMRPRSQQLTLTSRRASGDSRLWHVLTSWQSTLEITSWTVGPSGDFHLPSMLEGSGNQSDEIVEGGWELRPTRHRPMIVVADEVVVGDTYMRDIENDGKEFKAVVSFYPSDSGGANSLHARIQLEENWEISNLTPLRDNHILIVGRRYITSPSENELDGIDGHWFGGRTGGHVSLYAIIIHTVSRSEIARICLIEDLEACLDSDIATSGELPFDVAACAETVGASVWWKGIVMTGQDVRLAPESSQPDRPQTHGNQKKKKKKTPKKAGKKDGFARGMSLRG